MQEKLIKQAGLTQVQAEIYALLLEKGEVKASEIAKNTKRPRGVVYKGLDELIDLGLAERLEKEKITKFRAEHPSKLEKLIENRENELKKEKQSFANGLPDLISVYNLAHNKPGVRFFEGIEGVKKVIFDTLASKDIIYTYADVESVDKYIKKINAEYAKERDKLSLNKRLLVVDTPFARNYLKDYHPETTNLKFISGIEHFGSVMQIYDNKISYITLSETSMIGVIIEDKNIYEMHKTLFEFIWNNVDKNQSLSNAQ